MFDMPRAPTTHQHGTTCNHPLTGTLAQRVEGCRRSGQHVTLRRRGCCSGCPAACNFESNPCVHVCVRAGMRHAVLPRAWLQHPIIATKAAMYESAPPPPSPCAGAAHEPMGGGTPRVHAQTLHAAGCHHHVRQLHPYAGTQPEGPCPQAAAQKILNPHKMLCYTPRRVVPASCPTH